MKKVSITLKNIPLDTHQEVKKIQMQKEAEGERLTLEKIYIGLIQKSVSL